MLTKALFHSDGLSASTARRKGLPPATERKFSAIASIVTSIPAGTRLDPVPPRTARAVLPVTVCLVRPESMTGKIIESGFTGWSRKA